LKEFVMVRIILLIGLHGCMRCDELLQLCFDDVKVTDSGLDINIKSSKTDSNGTGFRFFALSSETAWKCPLEAWKKYTDLVHNKTGRIFRQCRNGSFTKQPSGRSFFLNLPKKIAEHLELQEFKKYTGHSIRRTSATWLAESGASVMQLKKFGRWTSDTVAQSYVDCSENTKRQFSALIAKDTKEDSKKEKTDSDPGKNGQRDPEKQQIVKRDFEKFVQGDENGEMETEVSFFVQGDENRENVFACNERKKQKTGSVLENCVISGGTFNFFFEKTRE